MGAILHGDRVELFKFEETGIVPLCLEVYSFIASGEVHRLRCDIQKAYYEFDEEHSYHKIVFPKLPEE